VADARRDWAHKLSTKIIRENQAVYVEDLAVKGLARTRLAKSVHDAGWAQFVAMLQYKAARYGRTFARAGRFDRDLNAAKNILAAWRAERLNACGGDVRPPFAVADAGEAGTHRSAA
jgi:putative transposase